MTFGQRISEARKKANLSQKELAALVRKEDRAPISPQYLNDLEHDRRNPPSALLLDQLAKILAIPVEVLYYAAGELPTQDRDFPADEDHVVRAYKAFRRTLRGE